MTVKSCCSLLFGLLFIESVCSIQNRFQTRSSHLICSFPYSCILTSECAERHSIYGTDEVLFKCEEKNKVCCPPIKSSLPTAPFSQYTPSTYATTTERDVFNGCKQFSYETKRSQSVGVGEYPVKQIPQAGLPNFGVVVGSHVHGSVKSQSTETRRPIQPVPTQARRPVERPTDIKPSICQSQEGRRPPQPQAPSQQNLQPLLQSIKPSLTSHRNYRLLPTESNCGLNNFANRITEGEEVSLGEFPWMVLTGLKDKYGNYRWNCGGTLINDWYVLTAAHCLIVDNRTIEYVRLGEHSLTNETDCYRELCLDPPEDVAIAEIIPHERWNTTAIKNDIALLRLSRNPLILGKSNIYPICLPFDIGKLNITSSTKYEVAGWGKTDWNAEEGSDVLLKASISGVSREECNICKDKKKQQYCPIVDTQLCIQGWKSVDVCKGDSGGPLMITRLNIYQIGITSFKGSEYCGAENIPSIFTRVESYLPWILDNIRE